MQDQKCFVQNVFFDSFKCNGIHLKQFKLSLQQIWAITKM